MNIHEHQGKELLRQYGVPVPRGRVAFTADEAEQAARALAEETGNATVVVKAQIHAGGRGKAGGVKVVKNAAEAKSFAEKLLGQKLVTHQTGPQGRVVKRLLVEEGMAIARELYLGMVVDRETGRWVVMASTEGGMEIEEVASRTPEKIRKEWIDPVLGLQPFQVRNLAFGLGLDKAVADPFGKFALALARAAQELDCSLIEINPLVVLKDGRVLALDAKIGLDDNALFRHPELAELRDPNEEDPREIEAKKYDLSYIGLDGTIGCMVNGAGLAMATMDIIQMAGGKPANFLDVGGGADAKKVTAAFKIICADPQVKGIYINIFGGIMKCDVLAEGVVAAVKEVGLSLPLVVRLEGTNVERGRQILEASGMKIVAASDMADGAKKIVELANAAKA
jgi:succinyl-CoA synthetase beta subunit